MAKKEGVFSEAGVCDCIIDSSIAGMIAHEAVGHTVEADLVLAGSVAATNLGKQVASDKITIIDFAHTAFGKEVPLPVYVDDEGNVEYLPVEVKDGKAVIITGHLSTYGIVGYNIPNPATNSNAEIIVSIILFALMFVGIAFSMKKQEVNA